MKVRLPGEIEADSVALTLDDGRYVEVSGDGAVRVWWLDRGEYSLTLPAIEHVVAECDAQDNAYANGHMTITAIPVQLRRGLPGTPAWSSGRPETPPAPEQEKTSMSETPSVIEFSINDGATWHHGRTIEAWVRSDPASLAVQRQAVRENAREWYGNVEHVVTRVMYETDPRCVNNQPPGQDADVSTDTGNHPDMTMVLYRLDQAERRLISKHPDAAKDPELAAMLRGIRDEAAALNGDSGTPG